MRVERIEPKRAPKGRSVRGIWPNRATYPHDPLGLVTKALFS